jgi:hypothetical protein
MVMEMVSTQGRVLDVDERIALDHLASAAAFGAMAVTVFDGEEFEESGGQAQVTRVTDGVQEIITYTKADQDSGLLTLGVGIGTAGGFAIDDPISPYPLIPERIASVQGDDESDDDFLALVPHSLHPLLPIGVRDKDLGESVVLELRGLEWVVADVLGEAAEIEGEALGTVPGENVDTSTGSPSDGAPPASSPTPTVVGGPGWFAVKWEPIVNNDPLTYEVHVSTTSGFTAGPGTKAGDGFAGIPFFVKTLPGGGAPLYGVTYFFRTMARDVDGSAPQSAQVSAQLLQIDHTDLAVDSVWANNILAGNIGTDELAANAVTTGKMTIQDYLDILERSSAPSAPAAGADRFYSRTFGGTAHLFYETPGGVEYAVTDLSTKIRRNALLQATTTGTEAKIALPVGTSVDWDDLGAYPTDGNDGFTLSRHGIYIVQAVITWATNGTGRRVMELKQFTSFTLAGSTSLGLRTMQAVGGTQTVHEGTFMRVVNPATFGDKLFFSVFQASGGNLNVEDVEFTIFLLRERV